MTVSMGMASPGDFKFFHQELHFEAGFLEQLYLEGKHMHTRAHTQAHLAVLLQGAVFP